MEQLIPSIYESFRKSVDSQIKISELSLGDRFEFHRYEGFQTVSTYELICYYPSNETALVKNVETGEAFRVPGTSWINSQTFKA